MAIVNLTLDQKTRLDSYIQKWTAINNSTEPTDFEKAEEYILKLYDILKFPRPPKDRIFHACSPEEAAEIAAKMNGTTMRAEISNQVFGCHDAPWMAYYDFCINELGLSEEYKDYIPAIELSKVCGWWMPYDDMLIIQERPSFILSDPQATNELHCETGPLVSYRDGVEVYALGGIRVDKHVVMAPETITAEEVNKENNQEARRILIERMGFENWLTKSGAVPIQEDDYGKLYHVLDWPVVVVKNSTSEPDGSFKNYILKASRENVTTAHDAVASTFGLTAQTYNPIFQS